MPKAEDINIDTLVSIRSQPQIPGRWNKLAKLKVAIAIVISGMKIPSPLDIIITITISIMTMTMITIPRWNGQTSTTPTCIAAAWKPPRRPALNKTLSNFGAIRFLLFALTQFSAKNWAFLKYIYLWSREGWLMVQSGTLQWELGSEVWSPDGGGDPGHDQQQQYQRDFPQGLQL